MRPVEPISEYTPRMAGNALVIVLAVQSPLAPTRIMGRGAASAANSTLSVPCRSPAAFSHTQPPWNESETMTTGAATLIRGSSAVRRNVCVPPPDSPVQPIRAESTSGRLVNQSSARMLFHVWSDARLNPHRLRRSFKKTCVNGLLSL